MVDSGMVRVPKAVLKPPHSRRFATTGRLRTARSVWSAARSPPLFPALQKSSSTFTRSILKP